MYGSDTFATDVSSTSMIVASMIEIAISHGLTLGFHSLGSGAAVSALILPLSDPADPARRPNNNAKCENDRDDRDLEHETGPITYSHTRNDGHARAKHALHLLLLIEHDLHRHPLHHFHIVARGIFRRQQTERRSAASLNAVNASVQFEARVSVHRNSDWLSRPHTAQLRFLEIGDYPNSRRDKCHQCLPYLQVISDSNCLLSHIAVYRRFDFGVAKVEFSLLDSCFIGLDACPARLCRCNVGISLLRADDLLTKQIQGALFI